MKGNATIPYKALASLFDSVYMGVEKAEYYQKRCEELESKLALCEDQLAKASAFRPETDISAESMGYHKGRKEAFDEVAVTLDRWKKDPDSKSVKTLFDMIERLLAK